MSLARLWAERGERQRAHDLLAPIYGWFTEGSGTRDLIEAKALLDVCFAKQSDQTAIAAAGTNTA